MSSITITEEALSKAAQSVRSAMLNSLPNPSDCEYEFSVEFQSKMDLMRLRVNYVYKRNRFIQRIASAFLILLITSSVWFTFNAEARGVVFSWIREVYENSIIYHFWGQDETGILPNYEPTWLPEGYEQVYEYSDETMHGRLYQKQNSKSGIVIEYYAVVDSIHTELLAKNAENLREDVIINGVEADFYHAAGNSNTNNLIWIDKKGKIVFSVNSDLAKSDILRIAEGLTQITVKK